MGLSARSPSGVLLDLSFFNKLRDTDYRGLGLIVAEGRIVVEKTLEAGLEIQALLCVPSARDFWEQRAQGRFEVQVLPRPEIEALAGFPFHRGVLALAARPDLHTLGPDKLPPGHLLFLWNVTDPDNLGTLIRSAAALGAGGIILGPGCADPYSRKALRASMGNALIRPLRTGDQDSFHLFEAEGLSTIAAALGPGTQPPESIRPAGSCVLVLGNEGWGLPPEVSSVCAHRTAIPMAADVDSLNVAAAGAILMYSLFYRRFPVSGRGP